MLFKLQRSDLYSVDVNGDDDASDDGNELPKVDEEIEECFNSSSKLNTSLVTSILPGELDSSTFRLLE